MKYYSQSEEYMGTDLYEDSKVPERFLTVDCYSNDVAREALVTKEVDSFAEIDDQWEHATVNEMFIGQFQFSTDFNANF